MYISIFFISSQHFLLVSSVALATKGLHMCSRLLDKLLPQSTYASDPALVLPSRPPALILQG